jgi:polar amino acid transport system permease protein
MSIGFVYDWDFGAVWQNFPLLLEGVRVTLILAAASMFLALIIGALLAAAAEFGAAPIRACAIAYTEFFRSLPFLILLFWIFLALPIFMGWSLTTFESGLLALTLNVSAFVGEAFRGGIGSVGPGQQQAGLALGMTLLQTIRRVVWPQAWRRTVPVVGSIWVGLFKDSALVSLIQVHDLMFQGRVIANRSFRYLEVFTVVAALYFIISYPQARLVDRLFERFRTAE